MDSIFLLRIVTSFIFGGAYIAFITRVSELFGAKVGGVLSSTPTTALMGMIFLALSESNSALVEAAPGTIIGFGSSMVMLGSFVYLHKRLNTVPSMAMSIILWAIAASLARGLQIDSLVIAVLFFGFFFTLASIYLARVKEIRAKRKPATLSALVLRMLFAGTVVSAVVITSRILGPFWGGLAAGFPALYISSLLILEREQGHAFTASVIKHLPMGGFSAVSFSLSLGILAKSQNSAVAIFIAFIISLAVAYGVYLYKHRKPKKSNSDL